MNEILKFLNSNEVAVSLVSSIASVLITLATLLFTVIYVRATIKLVHLPYKSYLKPINIKSNASTSSYLIIENFGPGIARNIKVTIFASIFLQKDSDKSKIEYLTIKRVAEEHTEIDVSKRDSIIVGEHVILKHPIIIEYSSITGKKYKAYYKYSAGTMKIFKELSFLQRRLHDLFMIFKLIQTPYIKIKEVEYFEKKYTADIILKILMDRGPLELGYISDEFEHKKDEDIKKCLLYLVKKKRVIVQGDKYNVIAIEEQIDD